MISVNFRGPPILGKILLIKLFTAFYTLFYLCICRDLNSLNIANYNNNSFLFD